MQVNSSLFNGITPIDVGRILSSPLLESPDEAQGELEMPADIPQASR